MKFKLIKIWLLLCLFAAVVFSITSFSFKKPNTNLQTTNFVDKDNYEYYRLNGFHIKKETSQQNFPVERERRLNDLHKFTLDLKLNIVTEYDYGIIRFYPISSVNFNIQMSNIDIEVAELASFSQLKDIFEMSQNLCIEINNKKHKHFDRLLYMIASNITLYPCIDDRLIDFAKGNFEDASDVTCWNDCETYFKHSIKKYLFSRCKNNPENVDRGCCMDLIERYVEGLTLENMSIMEILTFNSIAPCKNPKELIQKKMIKKSYRGFLCPEFPEIEMEEKRIKKNKIIYTPEEIDDMNQFLGKSERNCRISKGHGAIGNDEEEIEYISPYEYQPELVIFDTEFTIAFSISVFIAFLWVYFRF